MFCDNNTPLRQINNGQSNDSGALNAALTPPRQRLQPDWESFWERGDLDGDETQELSTAWAEEEWAD